VICLPPEALAALEHRARLRQGAAAR